MFYQVYEESELDPRNLRGHVCALCLNLNSASPVRVIVSSSKTDDEPLPRGSWDIPPGSNSAVVAALLFDRLADKYGMHRVGIWRSGMIVKSPYAVTTIGGWEVCAEHIADALEVISGARRY